MKNFRSALLAAALSLVVAAGSATAAQATTKIRVGASPTPHAEILKVANDVLKPQGYELQIIEYSDYVQPNMALEGKELDANFFQHKPYLDDFNKEKGTKLVSIGTVHYEPFGIYAGKTKSLDALKDGAMVAVPNDTTNEARALLLLQSNGLIKLKDGAGLTATRRDIAENPKKLKIEEIEAAQLVRALPDVDLAIINGNYAILGGLKVADALSAEKADSIAATTYANILAVRAGDENRPELKALINALKSDDIISSCGQRISCFYLCSQVYCAQTGTSALWDVTYEPDVGAMNRFLLISQQVVTFSSTRNVRNLNMRGACTMYIVGIDIAKRKHEAAVIDGEGAVVIKPFSFTNNCSGYNRLLAMLAKAKLPLDEVSFAMEATGHYWLALFTRLQKEGFRVQVINPVQTNSIRSFYIRQAKTDPRDALLIAEVIRFGHFSESTLHPENIYELRELCRGRHAIVSMQADVKRKVVALLDQVFPEYETAFTNMFSDTSMAILQTCPTPKELSEMPLEEFCHLIEVSSHKRFRMAKAQELQALARNSFGFAMAGDVFSTMIRLYAKHLDFLKQQVREMDRKIAEIMDTLDTPITTITGIGPTLGAYILSEIEDINRFSSAARLAAYAGIDPTMRQSGEYNGVRNRMSKRGSPYLRHAIWLAASSAVLHDPALKLYFQKKRDEGKPYMASVGHACRKMVSIIYAVMRDNKAYTPCIPNEISA